MVGVDAEDGVGVEEEDGVVEVRVEERAGVEDGE